jgi:peptidoglycan/xylan/chitin deacetylase (PgdA/CDA1 family)/SAM-dependent methyltransferase
LRISTHRSSPGCRSVVLGWRPSDSWLYRDTGARDRLRTYAGGVTAPQRALKVVLAELWGMRLRLSRHRVGAALVYHRVGDRSGDPARELVPAIGSDLFRSQARYMQRRYALVPASDLHSAILSRRPGQRIPVALTFDDDLPEHISDAVPLLRDCRAPASFFLCGASLDGPSSFWWERLEAVARHGRYPEALPEPLAVGAEGASIHETALRIQRLPRDERERVGEHLGEILGPKRLPPSLDTDDVQQLAALGFEIGFHTLRHDELPPLDDQSLQAALSEGRETLVHLSGRPVTGIAYPHGSADERVARAARAAGYTAGFTTSGCAIGRGTDPLLMGRIAPSFTSVAETAWSLVRGLAAAASAQSHAGSQRMDQSSRRLKLMRDLRSGLRGTRPPVGAVRFGSLRRVTPISGNYGFDRGLPVDRYYIEAFLRRHGARDVRGRVLEFGDDAYARRFGSAAGEGDRRVTKIDVLDVDPSNPRATIVGDLVEGAEIPSEAFDCIICTQTLHLIYEVPTAIRVLHRALKPGGVLLVTAPGISPIPTSDRERWGWHWGLTTSSARRLFDEHFSQGDVTVESYGNVLSAVAFLHGIAAEELRPAELDVRSPEYELLIAVRAQKRRP